MSRTVKPSPRNKSALMSDSPELDMQRLVDQAPTMIGVYDVRSSEYIYINKAVRRLLGYTPKEFIEGGLTFASSLVHPDDLPEINRENAKAIVRAEHTQQIKQTPVVRFEYRMRHKKGHYIWLQTSGSVYARTPRGKVAQVLNASIDITERKMAEEKMRDMSTQLKDKLHDHSDQLELALEASQMAIWEVDMRTGELTWSAKAAELLGLDSTSEITFENFMHAIHPDDWGLIQEAIEKSVAEQKATIVEHRVIWPDGSIHWFLTQGKVIFDNKGQPIKRIGAAVNIDNLKQTQAALTASEQRYQAFVRNSNVGIWRIEVDKPIPVTLPPSEQIKRMYKYAYMAEANNAMAAMYGYDSAESLAGARLGDLLIESDPKNTQYLKAFIKSNYNLSGVDSHEKDRYGKDRYFRNSLVGTTEKGALVRAWGTQQDVTEEFLTLHKLEESERRFRTMADSAPVFIWEADENKQSTYFNKYWLEFTGRTLKQEIGYGWKESVHPADLETCIKTYETAFDAREPFTQEYRLKRFDKSYHWILDTGVPRFSPDGKFLGYIGSCIDIEELRHTRELEKATALLRQQRAELLELNRAKDEFISLASHQLRTPATGVKQYLGIMLEGFIGSLSADQMRMLKIAYESNERQLTIIDDLLRVAHVDAGQIVLQKEKIDLVRLTKDVIGEQVATFKRRQQKTKFLTSHKKITALADQDKLRMVLENIIDNASKYTPIGKTISIKLKKLKNADVIEIADQGVGIAKKDVPKLFQKFSRVENPLSTSVGGTGLGLYWAKKIIDLHNGTIEVTSQLHKGTVFTITIPRQSSK